MDERLKSWEEEIAENLRECKSWFWCGFTCATIVIILGFLLISCFSYLSKTFEIKRITNEKEIIELDK